MLTHAPSTKAVLRFFHCFPVLDALDLYIDQKKYCKNVLYEDFTTYKVIAPGEKHIRIMPFEESEPIGEKILTLESSHIYTIIIAPRTKEATAPTIYLLEDSLRPIKEQSFLIRFGQFARYLDGVEFSLKVPKSPHIHAKKVSCYELGYYIPLPPNEYTLSLKDLQTQKELLTLHKLPLKLRRYYTIYLIGLGTKAFPTKAILSVDGNAYITFKEVNSPTEDF